VPCAAHSLNLAGVYPASLNNTAIAFFGIVQRLFTFSNLQQPLTNVNEVITNLPQGHSEAKWTSKASVPNVLYSKITEVCKILNDIVENVLENPELISTAQSLLHQTDFQFLCSLSAWRRNLNHNEKVNQHCNPGM
jgi:hypothetical protein